jgi:hypothetical protein
MSATPLVLANVGAEEGSEAAAAEPRAAAVARLFSLLFEGTPVFPWLALAPGTALAWLATEAARREAAARGARLVGPDPEVVARVHDKAFAQAVAERKGLLPPALAGLIDVLDAAELADPQAALARVEAYSARLPAWTKGRFTAKPRVGTSGRGRVAGCAGALDRAALAGGLARLARCGGALLEPWLERRADYSTQLYVDPDGPLVLLGTLVQVMAPSGVPFGLRGLVDARGRVTSGAEVDAALREAAVAVAEAARAEGFRGPCGVDAFVFTGPDAAPVLRPVVELNARFTLGTLALAAVRRALPRLRDRLGLSPGRAVAFFFGLGPPQGGWPAPPDTRDGLVLPADPDDPAGGAALWAVRDPALLDHALAPAPGPQGGLC